VGAKPEMRSWRSQFLVSPNSLLSRDQMHLKFNKFYYCLRNMPMREAPSFLRLKCAL